MIYLKLRLLFVASVFIHLSVFGQTSIHEKADSLRFMAKQMTFYEGVEDLYFQTLPNNFNDFRLIFGYRLDSITNEFSEGPLYNESYNHIMNILFTLDDKVEVKKYYCKIINISLNGKWQADGVNFFSGLVGYKLRQKPKVFFDILDKKSDEEINSFWKFYIDGPHGAKRLDGLDSMVKGYPRISNIYKKFKNRE